MFSVAQVYLPIMLYAPITDESVKQKAFRGPRLNNDDLGAPSTGSEPNACTPSHDFSVSSLRANIPSSAPPFLKIYPPKPSKWLCNEIVLWHRPAHMVVSFRMDINVAPSHKPLLSANWANMMLTRLEIVSIKDKDVEFMRVNTRVVQPRANSGPMGHCKRRYCLLVKSSLRFSSYEI